MKRLTAFVAALALTACATAPASAPSSAPTATAPNPAATSRAAQLLASAGRQDAPTQAEIERVLGAPDITRREGAGAALTYRLENCALLLLFASDQRNTMRLAEAHPSARRAGEAAPSLDQCAAEAGRR